MNSQHILPASAAETALAAEAPAQATGSGVVPRSQTDRRNFTWRTIGHSLAKPRRKKVNRADDRNNYYVDFHPMSAPLLCVGIVALAAVDSVATLYFYDLGATQFNGVVLALLAAGRGFYVAANLIATCVCTLMLVTVSSVKVFGVPARYFLPIVFVGYLLVILNMLRYFL